MRVDDQRLFAGTEETLLDWVLPHAILFGGPTGDPVVHVPVERWSLYPGNPRIAEVSEDLIQVVRFRHVIDIELDKEVVVSAMRVQPGVDVARLCSAFERPGRAVVLIMVFAREVPNPR